MTENTVVSDVVRRSLVPTYKITLRFVPDDCNFEPHDIKGNKDCELRLSQFRGGLNVICCRHIQGRTERDGGELG